MFRNEDVLANNDIEVTELDNVEKRLNNESDEPADFETAISSTGYGKFNVLLILMAIPCVWSSSFESSTMSFVFPAAQCDLKLTLENKGMLNSVTYIGMISSSFIWGFLFDTFGRKKLMLIGFFLDALFVVMAAFSQNFTVLLLAKFLGGFIINGPYAALTTYLSEFHSKRHRAYVQMFLGIIICSGAFVLPLLAWTILPLEIKYKSSIVPLELHSWNLFLFICALPATLSTIIFTFMPESPKFLMTTGRNQEALKVFKIVYKINTGKPSETYPIKTLVEEIRQHKDESPTPVGENKIKTFLTKGWRQFKPLFFPPHLFKIILVCLMQMLVMMSLNTLRLWLPQIFQAINDFEYYNNGTTASLCRMLEVFQPKNVSSHQETCFVNLNNSSVYINSMIVAIVAISAYVVAGSLINLLGKKRLLIILGTASGISVISMYFAQNSTTATALSSLFIAFNSVCINLVLACVVDLFPTAFRTVTVSLALMMGRSGAMLGNLVFPVLLQTGCAPPFFSIGFAIIGSALLSALLPNTDMKALL